MKHASAIMMTLATVTFTCFADRLAPKTEPLDEELIPVLFERIDKRETIQFELLCRALIGSQTTLRAHAATLLGDSGDRRAIPFLIDALSDESVHEGATYVDPGDSTTRHRANKSLKKLTGQDFGFVWSDPKEKREKTILKWVEWYRRNVEPAHAVEPSQSSGR